MNRYLCIHGHFYQPPRENPWLEAVELQDSAFPYHDWNERVTAEAYAPNTASRILGPERRIINIVNNFSSISFNVGPTLFSWLEQKHPDVYRAILEADRMSRERFSGHGAAVAQVYNHMIMPLANSRDRRTQVLWGIRDFEHRFGRRPEGMWLPETAVDLQSLEILAGQGILFTILAPSQARQVRPLEGKEWQDVSGGRIDPRRSYLCRLPGGGQITLFFYDGPVSRDIGFGGVLASGETFAERLVSAFGEGQESQLVHVATDGETYGHHRPFGDMALAYCLYHVEAEKLAKITVYGEYLERNPPAWEVEIFENSSWSCAHGVERWRSACGCNSGRHPNWQQQWRAPLREALDWLRDSCLSHYEAEAQRCFRDPWRARDEYIDLLLDRGPERLKAFLAENLLESESREAREPVKALKLLELQRHAMLMYTSCGWFFDDVSGLETTQILHYADRVLQLGEELFGAALQEGFTQRLKKAPSNLPRYGDGAGVYERLVRPARVDLPRVGVHFAVSSLIEEYPESTDIYCYHAEVSDYERLEAGKMNMVFGKVRLRSSVTQEQQQVSFAVLHLGGHIFNGGVREFEGAEKHAAMHREVKEAFLRSDIPEVIRLMDEHFGSHNYSLWHLFRDEQRKFFDSLLQSTLEEIRLYYRKIYEDNVAAMQAMNDMHIPLPRALSTPLEFILNTELGELIEADPVDSEALQRLAGEFARWPARIDEESHGLAACRRINSLMVALGESPEELPLLRRIAETLEAFQALPLSLNLWEAQNSYFRLGTRTYSRLKEQAAAGEAQASEWLEAFGRLGELLRVRVGDE